MAGNLGIAAKLFLASTVLAAGGAGAYYGTTVGWPAIMDSKSGATATSEAGGTSAENAPLAAGDLDAIASAWAEPESTRHAFPADSSATARTAGVALARAEAPVASSDRYELGTKADTPDAAAEAESANEAGLPTPADDSRDLAASNDQNTRPDVAEAAPEPETEPAVARGQEPSDEFASGKAIVPQPLNIPDQGPQIDRATGQTVDAPDEPMPAGLGERYRAADLQQREPAIVNPFSANEAPRGPAEPESIAPLPMLPEATADQRNDPQEGGRIAPLESDSRSARATWGGPSENARSSQPSPLPNNSLDVEAVQSASAGGVSASDGTGRPGERALEGAQRPALEIQKFAPPEIQVGKPAKFVVQVRNVGSQAADEVAIHDEVPEGTRLISSSPTAESTGSQLVWQLGKLSPGEDRSIEMQLMPMEEGEIGSVATVTYSAQASVKTRCTMPQLAIRMTAPDKVMIGQEQRVKIELRNPGSGDATGVMLFENVPQNVRHAAGPALEFEIGTLRAGETRELELVLLAEKAGKTLNVLSARADGNLQVQQQVEFEVIAPALAVGVNGPERRYLERPATYEVSVENPGTAPAHDVQIITKLPKGMRFMRANNLGEYDAATHAVYWSLAELPEGERGTVELVAMPIETGSQTLEVESRAGDGLSDHTKREIIVDGLAAIMFELRDLEDPIEVGRETGYEIRVVNQGTKAATNVQVAVQLPPGMQLVSAEGETQHTARQGGILFGPISQLAPKADTVYRVRVQGKQAGDQRVTVEVNTDDISQPIRREESTRVFGDE